MGLYRGGVTIITPTSVQWYIVTKKKVGRVPGPGRRNYKKSL